MEEAHTGMVRDPDSIETCSSCHNDTTTTDAMSLHSSLQGYLTVMNTRAGTEELSPGLELAFENHCEECHTSCGQCHVSRPTSAGGGLLAGHSFKNPPPMNLTCTGCHGSRVNDEYKGKNEAPEGGMIPADVHFNPGGMACFECHGDAEMHGDVPAQSHRYDDAAVECTDCHLNVEDSDENPQHAMHAEDLACQVCHSVDYKNCYSCHVQTSEEGTPYFKIEPSEMAFYIGKNAVQSEQRPWDYVLLRHVPIDRDSFSFYGEDLLPEFDSLPTFAYATPHNIQTNTPQNASCDACHGNEELFLTPDKVPADELVANEDVIVDVAPGP
ncbi:MAG: hypothetical protein KJP22_09935 [Acidimicrobiia bacterium]|nr:hypothetical protein [Acidimicrobiia bacterium]MBT8248312.1 hypothetical protein [Acidimicrobiia bacterium]